jgi:prepilin-type N-terminal cleavage/methylation domain-containing protein
MITKLKEQDSRGFTLIEVLISMAITIIVMGAVFGLLTRGQQSFQREPQIAELQQSARTALDMVSKDVLQAGAGLPPEFPAFTTTAINPAVGDGGSNPDVIEIVGASSSAGEMYFDPEVVANFDGANATMGEVYTSLEVGDLAVVYDDVLQNPNWFMGFVTAVDQTTQTDPAVVTLGPNFDTAVVPGNYSQGTLTQGFIVRVSVVQYATQLQGNDLILRRQVDFGQFNPVGMVDDFPVNSLVGIQPPTEQVDPPDPHPDPAVVLNPINIVSGVRITVAARSTQENLAGSTQGASGDYIRKTFSSNISPRNVLAGCGQRTGGLCSN